MVRVLLRATCGLILAVGLLAGGLLLVPTLGTAAPEVSAAPRRPPRLPPAVPPDAPEAWALWSYLNHITPLWDRDWPLVIQALEEFSARYPANPEALEKLYAAYLAHGQELERSGKALEARRRYEQAATLSPERGEALLELDRLDATP
jgi:hypothetical protein